MLPLATITTSIFIVLLAFSTSASARPNIERRGLPGAVYTCTRADFRGDCQWTAPTTQCRQQGPTSLGLGLESFGPDPSTSCILYEKFDCTGNQVQTVRFPGISSGLPQFGAFRCSPERAQANNDLDVNLEVKGSAKAFDPLADPRLAGGVGSMERKKNLRELKEMEKDGFKEGLIGLKKGVYY
ncbi:uncharacterized protein K460DRAFT_318680 [Cucurbitaria berberidis CBS 394.84]|uniref:Uncharacterized protein n=1 Tax=Cucurbitaria berberidis CBS 394.84 TaxID=1168544 RepID=A0A9P4L534_9PLEO|nr:uncharacterized protein K460DRAFT_318680 [Cucurbitaria berberidis CBS 394.84]KAF1841568.1 hypothetical protein K460DRAFT_318680 [Cucurbitaria berberidis CBS 394.84]